MSLSLVDSVRSCVKRMAVVVVMLGAVFASCGARATDIVLDSQGGTGVYTTLADAFAVARTAESPRVIVKKGSYAFTDTITLDYPVMVVGEDLTNSVLTGASLNKRAFVISDVGVVISNLTFQGIYGPKTQYEHGSAVMMSNGLVTDCRFIDNRVQPNYTGGAGVYMTGGMVRNCYFSGNGGDTYGLYGGSVYMTAGTLSGCTINGVSGGWKTASSGGGIYMKGGTVTNCVVKSCSSCGVGGIYSTGGTITHSRILSNSGSGTAGGIYAKWTTVKDCLITGNSCGASSGCGGGIYCEGSTIRHCTIYKNYASNMKVGSAGLYQKSGTVYDNIIWGNGGATWSLGSCYVEGGICNTNIVDVAVGKGVGNQAADPLLNNAANGDYTVKLGSPAIGAGNPGGGYDLVGVTRSATASTCGAYEFSVSGGDLQVALLVRQGEYAEGDTVTAEVMTAGGDGTALSYKWYLNGSDEVYSTEAKLVIENCSAMKLSLRVEVSQGGGTPVPAEKADAIRVYPRHVYVNESSENPQWPYASAGTAATSLNDAFAALWKDSQKTGFVDIEAGTYPLSSDIAVNYPIVICGKGRGQTLVDASGLTGNVSAFTLADDGCVLSNLTVKAGETANGSNQVHGRGVNMSRGLLADCRITDSTLRGYNSSGGPLYMTGGRAERCQFDKAYGGGNTGSSSPGVVTEGGTISECTIFDCGTGLIGGGLTISGSAVVERSVIRNCSGGNQGAGVYQTGGTLVNCLVYSNKNTSSTCAAGVYIKGGTMKYCTVTANATSSDGDGRSGVQIDGGATVVNNILWGNGTTKGSIVFTGSGYVFKGNVTDTDTKIATNLAGDPKFKDAVNTNFHIKGASAARGLAVLSYGVAKDFDGVERDAAGHCSGAYEFVKGSEPLSVDITMSTPSRVKVGTEITFTAVPENAVDESALTYAWTLDGESFGTDKSITTDKIATGVHSVQVSVTEGELTVPSQPVEFRVLPVKVYAGPLSDGVTPQYPYDDPSTAATNLNDALSALWQAADSTGMVEIAEGVVRMRDGVMLGTPVRIIGAGRDKTILTGSSSVRLFKLTDPDAEVSDLCVSNFTFWGGSANACGAFMMSTGVVRRVRVYGIKTSGDNSHYNDGLGLYLTGGRFEDCEIAACTSCGYYGSGCGIYMEGGLMDRCVVRNCTGSRTTSGGGFVSGGTVRNTLFVGCSSGLEANTYEAKVLNVGGTAKIVNCTVAGSTASYSASVPIVKLSNGAKLVNSVVWNGVSTPDVSGSADNIVNCCYKDATGVGNVAENPLFRNAARGDWRLRSSSPCVDKGDWTHLGASKDDVKGLKDLSGSSRLRGHDVDMGCYENPSGGLLLIVR